MDDPDLDGRSTRRKEREWPSGPGGQDFEPPKMVKDWKKMKNKKGEQTKPIDFDWEISPAKRIVASLESCTQDWVKELVKKRRTLDKQDATDSAQAIFTADRHGTLNARGLTLRNMRVTSGDADQQAAANAGLSTRQMQKIDTWINSTANADQFITEQSRTVLTLHCSLTAEEAVVLAELHRTYDQALCHFMRHILSPNFARYVNALRLKEESMGNTFGWRAHEKSVMDQLVNTSQQNDVLDFQLRRRDEFIPCYIWVAERESERKLLESDGVRYPELTWLSFVLHMLSNEERHILDVPPDNLLAGYSLDKLAQDAAASNPKSFKPFRHNMITSTLGKRVLRINRLVVADDNKKKDDQDSKESSGKKGGKNNSTKNGKDGGESKSSGGQQGDSKKNAKQLRALELPAALPQKDGKPDKEVYDKLQEGKTRQRVWKNIEDGNCVRCGSSSHLRADCPQKEKNWEKDFNKGKSFWERPTFQQRVQGAGGDDLLMATIPESDLAMPCSVRVGVDTLSNVDTCDVNLLVDVNPIKPVLVGGTGGSISTDQMGYLLIGDSSTGDLIRIPFLAVQPSQLPPGCNCILGLPSIRKFAMSVDACVQTVNPYLRFHADPDGRILGNFSSANPGAPIPSDYSPDAEELDFDDLASLPEPEAEESVGERDLINTKTNCSPPSSIFWRFILFLVTLACSSPVFFSCVPEQALLPGSPGGRAPVLVTGGVNYCDDNVTPLPYFDHNVTTCTYPLEHHSDVPLQYMQLSSFSSDQAVRAIAKVIDPHGLMTKIEVGIDTQSDVNLASRDLLTDIHAILPEDIEGIGGSESFTEEGQLTVATRDGEFVSIPAIVAGSHLPPRCRALLGVPGLNDLNIDLNQQKERQRQPLQCRLSEKKLRAWWEANEGQSIETKPFDVDAVDINPAVPAEFHQRIKKIIRKYLQVFEGSKGSLPKPFKADPVELNFKPDCKPSSVPEPKWSYGFGKVVEQWAIDGLKHGLLEPSQSEWSSRPHVVLKPPPGIHPSEASIADCKLRVVGDYRLVNQSIAKLVPNLPTGTDEMEKGAGYDYYFEADAHSCYNSFVLKPGKSREALAVWTPIGLVQPCVLPFGQKNSGTEAQGPYRIAISQLSTDSRQHLSNYVDDFMGYARNLDDLCRRFEDFLSVCDRNNITLNPHKVRVGYSKATFFGFQVDKRGTQLAEKHLDPIRNLVPPSDVSELRRVLGIFVQSRKYIHNYAHIVKPMTRMTGGKLKFQWGQQQQAAFDNVRDRLLAGVHLSAPDYAHPFHLFTDASDDGKGAILCQFPGISSQYPHSKEHNAENMRVICYFSKCWTDSERNRPPYYLEASALLWGMQKARFYALSSPFPLYTYSDHQPLKWMEKSEKGPVSSFIIENLSDLDYVHQYLIGKQNDMADSVSRYPMLGPRRLAPRGLHHSYLTLLKRLPRQLKDVPLVQIYAEKHTDEMAKLVRDWRSISHPPIVQKPVKPSDSTVPNANLILVAPRPDLAPLVLARLLVAETPFAVLTPVDLAPQAKRPHLLPGVDATQVSSRFAAAATIVMLDSQMMWVIGNVQGLANKAETFSARIRTPAPLIVYSTTIPDQFEGNTLPSTLEEWADAQQSDPNFDDDLPAPEFVTVQQPHGLQLYSIEGSTPKILIPPSSRESLVRKVHCDMHHLGAVKVHRALQQSYFWPSMRADCRKWLDNCPECELQKATRNEAHALFSALPYSAPRSRWCMDFQGMGKALTGEMEVLAFLDSTARFVIVCPLHGRSSDLFVPAFMDNVIFKHGAPEILHSDDAPEFLSEALQIPSDSAQITRTSTLGHHAQGNAQMEVWWRYWNRCMRLLPDSHYAQWPRFAQRIAFCYNTAVHSSLGDASPFEIFYGVPATNPYSTGPTLADLPAELPDVSLDDIKSFARAVQRSTAAFALLAKHHDEYVRETTAERMNEHGSPRSYSVGDSVKIYVPPTHTQMQRLGRPAKHIVAWRGPCEVLDKLSPTSYSMRELSTGRSFKRTVINIRPYRSNAPPPLPAFDPFYDNPLVPGELIMVRDTPDSNFYLARLLSLDDDSINVHYLGSRSSNINQAVFRPCYIHGPTDTITMSNTPPVNQTPYTGTLAIADLDELLVTRNLELLASDRLTHASRSKLTSARGQLATF